MADATRPHRNAAGDSSRAVSDPLGLLSLFNGTYTTAAASTTKRDSTTTVGSVRGMDICLMSRATTPVELIVDPSSKNAADSVQDNKVKEHVDDFKRESTRRRWEHARTSMNRKRTHDSATLEPPPPLYKCVVSSKKAPSEVIEPPLSGFADRPKALPARHIDGMLPPPTEHEPLGSIPKWLRHSPDAMAPSQRPEVECSKRVYTYGDPLPLEQPNETDELRFDSCFESGNLLSATRLFRTEGVNKETLPTASRQVHDRIPWVVDHEYDLQMHPDLKTSGNTQWFFFEVTKTRRLERYRFNVTNFAKSDSLYLEGMQPIVYSTKAAATMGIGWRRAGTVLCYSKNPSDVHRQQVCDMLEAVDTGDGDIDDGESTASGSASDDSDDEATSPVAPAQGGASSRQRDSFSKNKKTKGGTHTMSFDLEFEFEDDVVYLAYSHPYTYTDLQHFLNQLMSNPKTQHMCTRRVLCNTIAGNRCDLLTITAPPYIKPKVAATEDDARTNADNNNNKDGESSDTASSSSHERRLLVISARVHPGESNSSWIMQGMLEFLTSIHPAAVVLRKHFVFKVVPMLNPDGVINGNYRCSLSGQDLNRHWHLPCRNDHPTIAAFKHLIQAYQSRDESRVALFCDLHGHSRAQGLFLYGILSTADKQPSQPPKKVRNSVMTLRIAAALAVKKCGGGGVAGKDTSTTMGAESNADSRAPNGDTSSARTCTSPAATKSKTTESQDAVDTNESDGGSARFKTRAKKTFRAGDPRLFPIMLAKRTPGIFTKKRTSFKLGRGKSCTARAVVCRELGVRRSYTLEASFCGGVGGIYQESQFTTRDLMHMGRQWCLTLVDFFGLNEEVVTMVKLSKIASGRDVLKSGDTSTSSHVSKTSAAPNAPPAASTPFQEEASHDPSKLRGRNRRTNSHTGNHSGSNAASKRPSRPHTTNSGSRRRNQVPLLEDKMPKDDAAVLAEPRRNAEPVVAPTPKTDALSEIVVPAIDSVSARARVQELELGAEFRTSTDSNPLSSSMKAHGIDMAAFSAIAQEADQLLRETEGLTLDSPALWVAYDGINDEANAKDEIDLSVIVKTPTSRPKESFLCRTLQAEPGPQGKWPASPGEASLTKITGATHSSMTSHTIEKSGINESSAYDDSRKANVYASSRCLENMEPSASRDVKTDDPPPQSDDSLGLPPLETPQQKPEHVNNEGDDEKRPLDKTRPAEQAPSRPPLSSPSKRGRQHSSRRTIVENAGVCC